MAEYSTDEYLELMAEELKRIKLMADKGTGPVQVTRALTEATLLLARVVCDLPGRLRR